jgi:hypothetical protein
VARLLARHWTGMYEASERFVAETGMVGGYDRRIQPHAASRLQELREAGLLSEEDCKKLWDEPYEQNKGFWDGVKAAGSYCAWGAAGGRQPGLSCRDPSRA